MVEPPKKRFVTGIDISDLGKIRPTKIPSYRSVNTIHKSKIKWHRIAIDAGILAFIIIVIYAFSCSGGFVLNDHYVDRFVSIKAKDENFWSNLVIQSVTQPLSQPWILAGFAFDIQNFGMETVWYHISNLILHFLSCFYFYILIYRLARRFWSGMDNAPLHAVPLFAAAFLACHPLACESAAHITGRPALLTACNIFLALNFFLSGFWSTKVENALTYYVLTFLFFLLAVFSDVQGLILPGIILLLALLLKTSNFTYKRWLKKKWADFVFIGFLAAMVPIISMRGFTAEFGNGYASPLPGKLTYIADQFNALATYYLRCFFFPVGLSVYPPLVPALKHVDLCAILGIVVLGLAVYCIYRLWKEPFAALGLSISVLAFLPNIFCVQNEVAADRRFYLSLAGLALLLAIKLAQGLAPDQKDSRVRIFACVLLFMLGGFSVARTIDFQSDINLLRSAMRVDHSNTTAKGMLALAYLNNNKQQIGVNLAEQALKVDPVCQPAQLTLGKADTPQSNDLPGAIVRYKKAKGELEQAFSLAKSQHLGAMIMYDCETSLATVLLELNEYKRAKDLAQAVLAENPTSISGNLIMGRSLNGLNQYLDALRYLDKGFTADRTNPDYIEPITEAGLGVGTASTISTAYQTAKLGLRIKHSPKLYLLMARAAFAMRKFPESMQWTDTVLRGEPNNAKALYLRSYQTEVLGRATEAQKMRKLALSLEPDLATTMPIVIVSKKDNTVIDFRKLVETRQKLLKKNKLSS